MSVEALESAIKSRRTWPYENTRCVGDRLADLQLKILWEELLARKLDIEVMGPPKRLYSNFIRGIRELPVRIAAH